MTKPLSQDLRTRVVGDFWNLPLEIINPWS